MQARDERSDGCGAPGGVTGIVLAGGRSRRFGSDKLAADVDGRTLLHRAVEGVAGVATRCSSSSRPATIGRCRPSPVPVRRVADGEAYGGPLVGLRSGLEAAREPIVVVVGGDMPIAPLGACSSPCSSGRCSPRTMPSARPSSSRAGPSSRCRPCSGRAWPAIMSGRLVDDGERRLRSLFERLPTRVLEEGDWRPLDPDGDTIRDVDRPGDLWAGRLNAPPDMQTNASAGGRTRSREGGSGGAG